MTKRKKLVVNLGLFLLIVTFILGFFLFTSPEPKLAKQEGSFVKVIGDISNLKKMSQRTNRQEVAGGKDLCDPSSPFGECYPPTDSVWADAREQMKLVLNDKQVTDLVRLLKPESLLLSDIIFKFNGNTARAEATSYYPFAPGFAQTEIQIVKQKKRVNKLYLGRISAPERLRKMFEQSLDPLIINSLSHYGVGLSRLEIVDGLLHADINVPKGLVQVTEQGEIIINADVIKQQEQEERNDDYTIQ